jgi:hypothetical protein
MRHICSSDDNDDDIVLIAAFCCSSNVDLNASCFLFHFMHRSSDDDDDDIVPCGRLLEDYHRLALHTERQLRGELL